MVRAALEQAQELEFEFKKKFYVIPHVLEYRYIIGRHVGQGGFGMVFEGTDAKRNMPVIVKIVPREI